jgi:phosphopantetheinyl transferase (holo-ACP synthase)
MQGTGNDIIALQTINIPRSNNNRFYSKILSTSEQELYRQLNPSAIPFEKFLWLCWSVKESVYKYVTRYQPAHVFSPVKMTVQHIELPDETKITSFETDEWEGLAATEKCFTGSLVFDGAIFYFKSKILRELIATVVSEDENFKDIHWGIKKITQTGSDYQSNAVRSFLLKRLNNLLPGKEISVDKSPHGFPLIYNKRKLLPFPVSFAHHGNFVAYSFLLQ